MRQARSRLVILTLTLIIAAAFTNAQAKPTVYVVNYPLQYFTERIGGDHINVVFPAPPDEDPAFWDPDIAAVADFQAADLIIDNGATYAKWMKNVSLPKSKLVDTSAAFKSQLIEIKDVVTHSHGPAGEHAHTGTAFTTWLNFDMAAQQAKAIATALNRLVPEREATFEKQYEGLKRDLMELDKQMQSMVANKPDQPLLASHPVYQYFAARYDLNLQSVLWEPDRMPDKDQWQALQAIRAKHPATWMIWEGEPMSASVDKLQAMGVKSLVFDPCGNTPEQGDFLSIMRQNIANLQQAF